MKYFLHKVQLHVSALDNDDLQVVHEVLIKQLYKTYMGCLLTLLILALCMLS